MDKRAMDEKIIKEYLEEFYQVIEERQKKREITQGKAQVSFIF